MPDARPSYMRKLLISFILGATLVISGCSQDTRFPFSHRIDVQQGNVLTQEKVNQVRPGMSRRQVKFILGTPLLEDPFHEDRWDYIYMLLTGDGDVTEKHIALYFADDKLDRIEGTMRPGVEVDEAEQTTKFTTVTVPPQKRKARGWLTRLWHWIGFGEDDV